MAAPVQIQVRRTFAHPADAAYAWLTDFRDDDAEIADAVIEKRHVTQRSADRVVYEGETSVLGARAWAITEVRLRPPLRWEARVLDGPRKGSTTDYELAPRPGGCEVTVTYRFVLADPKRHLALRLAKPLVRRQLSKMWDGFARAMDAQLKR